MSSQPLLELEGVGKTYPSPEGGAPLVVLRGIDLALAAGESVAIVGPSGCGKSTLLNIAGALDVPSEGSVRVAGRDLSGLDERELAGVRNREIGFVFQLHHLLPQCPVLENVLLPSLADPAKRRDPRVRERAARLLERVGLAARAGHRPGQLSGGECQRAALVRALVNGPRLLLADEPTGSLDGASASGMADLLVELNREERVALVVVTHSPELARRMGRVFRLDGGRLEPSA